MAIKPKVEYPYQTITTDPAYPHGKARNVTVPGDGTGTPLEQKWVNDVWGFLQAVLAAGGVTPSGIPDTASASDYLNALKAYFLKSPSSSTDNAIARFDGTTGKISQNSLVTVGDTGSLSGVENVGLSGEVSYASPKSRVILVDPLVIGEGQPWRSDAFGAAAGSYIFSPSATQYFGAIDLSPYLRTGMVLTQLEVLVHPQVANATEADRMAFELIARPWSSSSGALVNVGGPAYDSGSNAAQTVTVFSGTHTVDRATYAYRLGARSAVNGGSQIWGVRLTVNDPGPRNH